jgi:hypothetical protein
VVSLPVIHFFSSHAGKSKARWKNGDGDLKVEKFGAKSKSKSQKSKGKIQDEKCKMKKGTASGRYVPL